MHTALVTENNHSLPLAFGLYSKKQMLRAIIWISVAIWQIPKDDIIVAFGCNIHWRGRAGRPHKWRHWVIVLGIVAPSEYALRVSGSPRAAQKCIQSHKSLAFMRLIILLCREAYAAFVFFVFRVVGPLSSALDHNSFKFPALNVRYDWTWINEWEWAI